jgi:hypothetical protein
VAKCTTELLLFKHPLIFCKGKAILSLDLALIWLFGVFLIRTLMLFTSLFRMYLVITPCILTGPFGIFLTETSLGLCLTFPLPTLVISTLTFLAAR